MPYTISHAGYTLLFRKFIKKDRFISTIFIASFVPDFDIIFRFSNSREHLFNYSFIQIITILLPIALFIDFFFNLTLKNRYQKILHIPVEKKDSCLILLKSNIIIQVLLIIFFILFHLLLDLFSHFDAYNGMMFLYGLLGNKNLLDFYFLISMYLVPLLTSVVGLYFLYRYYKEKHLAIPSTFVVLFITITVIYAVVRLFIIRIEKGFEFDYIVIQLTGGIFVAFLTTPFIYNHLFLKNDH